jgi:hypothetical protein
MLYRHRVCALSSSPLLLPDGGGDGDSLVGSLFSRFAFIPIGESTSNLHWLTQHLHSIHF